MKTAAPRQHKTALPVTSCAFFFLSQLLLLGFLWHQKTTNEHEHLASLIAHRQAEYQHVLACQKRLVTTIYDEVINLPETVQLVQGAFLLDDAGRQRARDLLYARLFPAYERLRQGRVRQVHFHFPDGTSFLRLHHPSEFGDNLFAARPSIRLANTKKIYVEGFEEGRDFHAFRHVFPLFLAGEHVGSVEIDIPFYFLRQELVELYPATNLFIIKKEVVESLVFKQNLKNYLPSRINDDFLMEKDDLVHEGDAHLENSPDPHLISTLNRGLRQELSDHLATDRPFAMVASHGDVPYVLTALPVMDTAGKAVGYILYYQKDLDLSELLRSYYLTYGAVTLLVLLLLALYQWSMRRITAQNIFLQTIIESLPHPFYVVDAKDYSIKIANSLVAAARKWQGGTCYAITHDSDRPCDGGAHTCPLQQVVMTKQEVVVEHVHRNSDGEERQVEVHGCPIFNEAGEVVQMIEYAIDITARKVAEQEREMLIADLQAALKDIKQLSGFIPICASCKNIRNDQGYWQQIERYISEHSEAQFSHGICPQCAKQLYPDVDFPARRRDASPKTHSGGDEE